MRRNIDVWQSIAALRDQLQAAILDSIPNSYVNGAASDRLPNTLNFGIRGIDSDAIVTFFDGHDICVSTGSACLENALTPSHVVYAIITGPMVIHGAVQYVRLDTEVYCTTCNRSTVITNCNTLADFTRRKIEKDAATGQWKAVRDRVPQQFRGKLKAG